MEGGGRDSGGGRRENQEKNWMLGRELDYWGRKVGKGGGRGFGKP